jgi:hypothetical protein
VWSEKRPWPTSSYRWNSIQPVRNEFHILENPYCIEPSRFLARGVNRIPFDGKILSPERALSPGRPAS